MCNLVAIRELHNPIVDRLSDELPGDGAAGCVLASMVCNEIIGILFQWYDNATVALYVYVVSLCAGWRSMCWVSLLVCGRGG